ncbi:MAG TPA: chemotaxis protein CheB [Nitrospirota bacterium]|nr:chemotaxis protein CheB [Nitrospirota bacterium]
MIPKKQIVAKLPANKAKQREVTTPQSPFAAKSKKHPDPPILNSKVGSRTSIKGQRLAEDQVGENSSPIVGIDDSAAGLEACTIQLEQLPSDRGMAFVLARHLAPSQSSILSVLLSNTMPVPVLEVQDGISVEPGHNEYMSFLLKGMPSFCTACDRDISRVLRIIIMESSRT